MNYGGVSLGYATCLFACGARVWSSETVVDDEGEGQAGPCRWTGSGEERMPGHGLRDRRSWVTDRGCLTPRVINKYKSTRA